MSERIAVIGLGYAGLPLAVAFARSFTGTVGFNIRPERVGALGQGMDHTGEVSPEELRASGLKVTSDPADLAGATFFVVTVPTPIDRHSRPDLNSLLKATKIVGLALRPGSVVVYE